MRRLRKSQAFLRASPNPWKKLPRAWNRYPLWYSITPPPPKSPPPAAQSFSIRYKTWKSFWQSSSYNAIPPSPGPSGPGDFLFLTSIARVVCDISLPLPPAKGFRAFTPLPATVLPGFSLCPPQFFRTSPSARHSSSGLFPQPRPNSLPPLTDRKNGLIIKMFISLADLLEDKK